MKIKEMKSIIESLLFVSGELLPLSKIADVLEIDKSTAEKLMNAIMDEYNTSEHGIHIMKIDNGYQLCSNPENFSYVTRLIEVKKPQPMSNALLEVLSIIAYNQPITKSTIGEIRGVASDYLVNKLIERDLVRECGRLNAPGKPILFKTTEEFLKQFGLSSLSELPNFNSLSGSLEEKEEITISDLLHEEEMKEIANDTDDEVDDENIYAEYNDFDNYDDYIIDETESETNSVS